MQEQVHYTRLRLFSAPLCVCVYLGTMYDICCSIRTYKYYIVFEEDPQKSGLQQSKFRKWAQERYRAAQSNMNFISFSILLVFFFLHLKTVHSITEHTLRFTLKILWCAFCTKCSVSIMSLQYFFVCTNSQSFLTMVQICVCNYMLVYGDFGMQY